MPKILNVANWYSKRPWARAILSAIPYGKALNEYLLATLKGSEPNINIHKYETETAWIVNNWLYGNNEKMSSFKTWGNVEELRKVIKEYLKYYKENPGATTFPSNLYYDHKDETGGEILVNKMLQGIWDTLRRRGHIWADPHNDKKYITELGENLRMYLEIYS